MARRSSVRLSLGRLLFLGLPLSWLHRRKR
jgi:hypothetical protein